MTNVSTRRARQIAHTREDILHAAAKAFARSGFEATTMQDIAKEAGYTVASLYAYFDSKEEIVDGLVAQLSQELLETFDTPVSPGLTFKQKLEGLLLRQVELEERWQAAFTALLALKSDRTRAARSLKGRTSLHSLAEFFKGRLAQWIQENATAEEIGGRDPEDVAYILKGMLHAIFNQWMHSDKSGHPGDRIAFVLDVFFHGVAGPARPGAASEMKP